MANQKPPEKPTKRKPGRPRSGEAPVTPEVLETIAEMRLRSHTLREIAKVCGIDHSTVRDHLDSKIKPLWRDKIWHDLQRDMLKTDAIEQEAWTKFRDSNDLKDLDLVKWAIEHRAKIGGDYAAAKLDINQVHTMRVAGQTPDQFDADTMKMILEGMQQRSAYQAAVRAGRN